MKRRYDRLQAHTSILPWWIPLVFAVVLFVLGWMVLPRLIDASQSQEPLVVALRVASKAGAIKMLAGMFIFLCCFGSVRAWIARGERKRLLDRQRDIDSLRQLDWKAFERLVGEAYRRQGHEIIETGQGGADGGIDLVLRKNNRKMIVQVKRWQANSVGAPVVRELYGLLVHYKVDSAAIVTLGRFTKEAWNFAHGKPIDLVTGTRLLEMIKAVQRP